MAKEKKFTAESAEGLSVLSAPSAVKKLIYIKRRHTQSRKMRQLDPPVSKNNRLSICYAVPGHHLLPEVGPSRNVLSVAEKLSRFADVTVAFRKVLKSVDSPAYNIVELDPHGPLPSSPTDDSAVRGTNVRDFYRYLSALKKFVADSSGRFDIVMEKSWLFSGYLTRAFERHGVPGVLIENLVRMFNEPLKDYRSIRQSVRHHISQAIVRHYAKRVPAIIVETEELKAAMVELWGLDSKRIEVVELGIDRRLFHPRDQNAARKSLKINPSATVLLYVGVLDPCHNLRPTLEAMNQLQLPAVELHIVGDGMLRRELGEVAQRGNSSIFFHGRVSHGQVPEYIAAADLCLAPYEPESFFNNKVSFSTLKIPEYMACGRAVVSVPSGHILKLIENGVTGFLFPNTTTSWEEFLGSCPSRAALSVMGSNAGKAVSDRTWEFTSTRYLQICEELLLKNVAGGMRNHRESDALLLRQKS